MSEQTPSGVPADSPPAATPEAQEKAHDPTLISPEPPAEALLTGALS